MYDDFATPLHHMVLKCEKCEKAFRQNEMKYFFTFIETVFLILLVFSYIHDKLLLFIMTKALMVL